MGGGGLAQLFLQKPFDCLRCDSVMLMLFVMFYVTANHNFFPINFTIRLLVH